MAVLGDSSYRIWSSVDGMTSVSPSPPPPQSHELDLGANGCPTNGAMGMVIVVAMLMDRLRPGWMAAASSTADTRRMLEFCHLTKVRIDLFCGYEEGADRLCLLNTLPCSSQRLERRGEEQGPPCLARGSRAQQSYGRSAQDVRVLSISISHLHQD